EAGKGVARPVEVTWRGLQILGSAQQPGHRTAALPWLCAAARFTHSSCFLSSVRHPSLSFSSGFSFMKCGPGCDFSFACSLYALIACFAAALPNSRPFSRLRCFHLKLIFPCA